MNTCLITGCRLVIPAEGKSLWGDLHLVRGSALLRDGLFVESAYVFNGVLENGEAAWEEETIAPVPNSPERRITLTSAYFERRGVVCFVDGAYNTAAKEYVK